MKMYIVHTTQKVRNYLYSLYKEQKIPKLDSVLKVTDFANVFERTTCKLKKIRVKQFRAVTCSFFQVKTICKHFLPFSFLKKKSYM